MVEPLYISTCILRIKGFLYILRDFHIQHTTKYYNKYVLNDHTELSYLSGSISSKNLSPSLPSIFNDKGTLHRTTTQFAEALQQTIQMGVDAQAEENKNARLDKQFEAPPTQSPTQSTTHSIKPISASSLFSNTFSSTPCPTFKCFYSSFSSSIGPVCSYISDDKCCQPRKC